MTFDAVALCRDRPGPAEMIAAMLAAGPDLRVDAADATQSVQLYHRDGRLQLTIDGARLVQVPGEARRLLGIDTEAVPHPVWWVEGRAPGGDPDAAAVARRFTSALVAAVGGVSWCSR
jgi:hypothetical protein